MIPGVGRGRGYSRGNLERDPILRRPGGSGDGDDRDLDSIISQVQAISLEDETQAASTLNVIEDLMKSYCQNEDNLRHAVKALHERSLEDRQFGQKSAAACGTLSTLEVNNTKFRFVLLRHLQKDFEERAQLQTCSLSKFLNSIAFLGEIFHHIQVADGSHLSILSLPILQYQDMLLTGDEKELELFTMQLALNGSDLLVCCSEKLTDLLCRVRSTLMTRNLSGRCRCWLLLALDMAAYNWGELPSELKTFYKIHLGSTVFSQFERNIVKPENTPVLIHSPIQNKTPANNIITETRVHRSEPEPTRTLENSEHQLKQTAFKTNSNERSVSLRKCPDRDDSERSKNSDSFSGNRKRYEPEHDNRFDMDESFYGRQRSREEDRNRQCRSTNIKTDNKVKFDPDKASRAECFSSKSHPVNSTSASVEKQKFSYSQPPPVEEESWD